MASLRLPRGDNPVQYLPAVGVVARFKDGQLPVICWALTDDDRLIGLVFDGHAVRSAEDMGGERLGGFLDFQLGTLSAVL